MTIYDPEAWLITTLRGIKDYAKIGFDNAVKNNLGASVGDEVYEIIMEYPSADTLAKLAPFTKTIVHFEIDDIDTPIFGMGNNIFNWNYDPTLKWVRPQEAQKHILNFDVGIWASDRSGGITSRLRAYEILNDLFGGASAKNKLMAATELNDGGVELLSFTGGRFLADKVNDIIVHRMVDCTMMVQIFSRTPIPETTEAIETIEEILQDQSGLTIPS